MRGAVKNWQRDIIVLGQQGLVWLSGEDAGEVLVVNAQRNQITKEPTENNVAEVMSIVLRSTEGNVSSAQHGQYSKKQLVDWARWSGHPEMAAEPQCKVEQS